LSRPLKRAKKTEKGREEIRRMEMKIKVALEFSVSETGLEDALAEFDELTVEGLLREILDKSIACDDISTRVIEGPNTLEEYDTEATE
jgi:hypothetical protein